MILETLFMKTEKSCLNNGIKALSGKKVLYHSNELNFNLIKDSSRKLNMTINDLFTAAVSVGVKKYMKKRNDPCQSLQLVIPAAVRWEFYQTFESVKLENKFAAFPVKIPLVEDLEDAIP